MTVRLARQADFASALDCALHNRWPQLLPAVTWDEATLRGFTREGTVLVDVVGGVVMGFTVWRVKERQGDGGVFREAVLVCPPVVRDTAPTPLATARDLMAEALRLAKNNNVTSVRWGFKVGNRLAERLLEVGLQFTNREDAIVGEELIDAVRAKVASL